MQKRGTASKAGSARALFSMTGTLRTKGLTTAVVTSQVNPRQALEQLIWDRMWL